jgi:hypothetical protein
MPPQLETARLLLRPAELSDAEQTQILFPQWEIVRLLANHVPWPYPAAARGAYTKYLAVAPETKDAAFRTLPLDGYAIRRCGAKTAFCKRVAHRLTVKSRFG